MSDNRNNLQAFLDSLPALPAESQAEAGKMYDLETVYVKKELDTLLKTELLIEKRHLNDNLRQDRELRKTYANKVFNLTCGWSFAIFGVLLADGLSWIHLSEGVLITLITSTTLNFFSFFLLVMKYLFQVKHDAKDRVINIQPTSPSTN